MEKIVSDLKLEIYSKNGSTMYCDYYFYNGISSERGTTKAGVMDTINIAQQQATP